MAKLVTLPTYPDDRGLLTVAEGKSSIEFEIARVYYIYATTRAPRGGHRHYKNRQALICVHGSCEVEVHSPDGASVAYALCDPKVALIVEPEDWHVMRDFTPDAVLLVLASEKFDAADYIDNDYTVRKA